MKQFLLIIILFITLFTQAQNPDARLVIIKVGTPLQTAIATFPGTADSVNNANSFIHSEMFTTNSVHTLQYMMTH
jgi:hypothetical protein